MDREMGRDGKRERWREMEREMDREMERDGKRERWREMERDGERWREIERETEREKTSVCKYVHVCMYVCV